VSSPDGGRGGWGSGWDNQAISLLLLSLAAAGFTGIFGYSPAPGAGNLVFSLTAPGVAADPFGNTVTSDGLAVYGTSGQELFVGLSGTLPQIRFFTGDAAELTAANLAAGVAGAGTSRVLELVISGPRLSTAGHQDWVQVQFQSPSPDGTIGAGVVFRYVNNAQVASNIAEMISTGLLLFSQAADSPGSTLGAVAYALGGLLKWAGPDGNAWVTGRSRKILAATQTITGTNQQLVGFTWNVISGNTYAFDCVIECLQGATATAQGLGLAGVTTGGFTRMFYFYVQDGATQSFSNITNQGTIGILTSPAYAAARTFYLYLKGQFTAGATGSVQFFASWGGTSFQVIGNSYCELQPVG
jgi:hypothetical protein